MLNKLEKRKLEILGDSIDSLRMDKFRIANEKLIVEKELEEVRKQLEDFKNLVNHLTSKKFMNERNDDKFENFVGFLDNHIRY